MQNITQVHVLPQFTTSSNLSITLVRATTEALFTTPPSTPIVTLPPNRYIVAPKYYTIEGKPIRIDG
jgi:hypothetical protein